MQKSNAPTKLTVAFASGTGAGPVNTIPLTTNPTSGGASYQTGFTSVNMEPIASGGVPPYGADVNGLFQNQTKAQIWQQAGYMYPFDATFAGNANIGGYPSGSVLMMGSGKGLWLNQSDNNATSPDATGSVGWLGLAAAGTSTINTTGGTTMPDPSVLGVTTLLVTGALTSNATLVLPLTGGVRWIVVNNTTGSYTLTVQGSSGTGVSVTSGSPIAVFTDGTNYYGVSANLSGAYLPIGGTAVAATKLATARTIAMTGDVSWTSPAFDGSANVTAAGIIAAGAVSLAKMANFQANSLMGNPTGSAAAPSAITLQNGLTFSGTNLGLGAITPTSVAATGAVSGASITSSNNVVANTNFISSNAFWVGATTGAGTILFRPNGLASSSGQLEIDSTGVVTGAASINATTNLSIGAGGSNSAGTIFSNSNWGMLLTAKQTSPTLGDFGFANSAGTTILTLATSGSVFTSNLQTNGSMMAASYNTSSDEALKAGIDRSAAPRDLSSVPYATWSHLRGVPVQGRGAIAQDMRKVAPEHVHEATDGTLGIDYSLAAYEQAMFNRRLLNDVITRLDRIGA